MKANETSKIGNSKKLCNKSDQSDLRQWLKDTISSVQSGIFGDNFIFSLICRGKPQTISDFLFPDPPGFDIVIRDAILSVTHSLTLEEAKKTDNIKKEILNHK